MVRSILLLLAVGLVGSAVLGLLFGFLMPLLVIVLKVAVILVLGYFVLRLISPARADEVRERFRRMR